MDFRRVTVSELSGRVARGEVSARELVGAALNRIDAVDPAVGAFVAVDGEAALEEAAQVDERVAAGEPVGPLAGIPLAVKDLQDAAGLPTTRGSILFAGAPAAAADCALVERLRAAGCVVVGKTNTSEMGWKPDTVNGLFGPTRNPWSLERSVGGSSGGSAAALAAGMVPLATGSDGGGSIRIPASICGLAGFKPSPGRIPTTEPSSAAWLFLASDAPMARTVRDTVLALDAVVGPDPADPLSLPLPDASWSRSLSDLHPPRRVGWAPTLGYATLDSQVRTVMDVALGKLADAGAEIVEVDPVFDRDPVRLWMTICGSAELSRLDRYRSEAAWSKVDAGVAQLIEWADALTAADLMRAVDAAHALNGRLVQLFHRVGLLVTPVCAGQTPRLGEAGTIDGRPDDRWVRFTYPFNMTRSPAGTVCAGSLPDGMPAGIQVVGPQHADVAVLRLMAFLEDLLGPPGSAPV